MKCGICHKDQMNVYSKRNAWDRPSGNKDFEIIGQQTIRSARDLQHHKRNEHPEELKEIDRALREADQVKRQKKSSDQKRRHEAEERVGSYWIVTEDRYGRRLEVVQAYRAEEQQIIRGLTRRPEPEGFEVYNALLTRIAELKEEAEVMLKRSWEAGVPMTQKDLFEIKNAGEEAYHCEPSQAVVNLKGVEDG